MKISQWLGALVSSIVLSQALHAAALNCDGHSPTADEVEQWRLESLQQIGQGSAAERTLSDQIKGCFGTEVPACLQRLNDYVRRNDLASPTFDAPVRTSPAKQPPAELFLSGAGNFEYRVPEDIEERAAAMGWPSVRYKSRHSGGFDRETSALLMIYVSGEKVDPPVPYDRWLNFALPEDPESETVHPTPSAPIPDADAFAAEARGELSLPKIFTMVSLDRSQAGKPCQVYFQRFLRSGRGQPIFKPESNANPKRCVSCHPNGLRAISPLGYHVRKNESAMDDESWHTVKLINDAMVQAAGQHVISWRDAPVSSGSSQRKPLLSPASFGPIVGPLKPLNGQSRTADFISQCAQRRTVVEVRDIFNRAPGRNNVYRLSSRPQIDSAKVLRNMNCGACHGTTQRGGLSSLTDWAQIDFKILVGQSMPLGVHKNPLESSTGEVQDALTADERIALANCLQAEFALEREQMAAWLTQVTCR